EHGSTIDNPFSLMRDVIVAARKYLDWLCQHESDDFKYIEPVNYAWGAWDRVFPHTPPPSRPKKMEVQNADEACDVLNVLLAAVNSLESAARQSAGSVVQASTEPQGTWPRGALTEGQPARALPNETEQKILNALYQKKAISLEGLKAISSAERPT